MKHVEATISPIHQESVKMRKDPNHRRSNAVLVKHSEQSSRKRRGKYKRRKPARGRKVRKNQKQNQFVSR